MDRLRQNMEELVASLKAEVKQITDSLEKERNWAHKLENERDQFRERLDTETRLREKQDNDRVRNIEELRDEVKELKNQLVKKDSIVQQYENDLAERDRLLQQKSALLEEKCQAYDKISQISEQRKKQIFELKLSLKTTTDDDLTRINNEHRALLKQELEKTRDESKQHEDNAKHLALQLYNAQKQAENLEQKLENVEALYHMATVAIQEFIKRAQQK